MLESEEFVAKYEWLLEDEKEERNVEAVTRKLVYQVRKEIRRLREGDEWFIPYGSFVDGTLGRGSQLCLSMQVNDKDDILVLKKDIKKALISNPNNCDRYAFLEEEDQY